MIPVILRIDLLRYSVKGYRRRIDSTPSIVGMIAKFGMEVFYLFLETWTLHAERGASAVPSLRVA